MSETFLTHIKRIYFKYLRGGARSRERTVLGMAYFPDKRVFTGNITDLGRQAANPE